MIQKLIEFQRAFNNHHINLSIPCRNKIIHDFTCYLFTELSHSDDLSDLVKKSEIIIIDKIFEHNNPYFVIFIDKAILFIPRCEISKFSNLIKKEERLYTTIASKKMTEEQLSHELNINFYENINEYEKEIYNDTIKSFSKKFSLSNDNHNDVKEVWRLILPSFSAYFINKSS